MPAPTDSIEISALTAGAALDGTEIIPLVQGGATVRSTLSAALTYFNANASLDAARITGGTLAVARGGTSIGSYAIGDLLYASGATTLAKLAGVATGNALISGGVATAPSWGKVGLTTHVSGILPLANGGSGADLSATGGANQVLQQTSVGGVVTVGTLNAASIAAGTLAASRGGTGVSNADANTLTLGGATSITGGGTLALGGFTLTVPATGSAAILAVANVFTALQTTKITDAATNTTAVIQTLNHASSGTPAASFGAALKLSLASATVADRDAAQIETIWSTATDATRTSELLFKIVSAGGALTEVGRFSGGGFTGAGQLQISTNGWAFIGNTNTGMYRATTNRVAFLCGGSTSFEVGSGLSVWGSAHVIGWSSSASAAGASNDTGLARSAAAVVEVNTGTAGQWGALKAGTRDAGTTTITDGLTLGHQSTGTPAAGFGAAIQINLNSSTTADQNAVRLTSEWVIATHASRTARYKINVYDTASREVLRGEASGSAAMIGFLGANAAIRQTSGADLTNNVTVGGTDDTIADFTDLTTYATDAATIRNDIYQLARKLKQVNDALRLYGLLT